MEAGLWRCGGASLRLCRTRTSSTDICIEHAPEMASSQSKRISAVLGSKAEQLAQRHMVALDQLLDFRLVHDSLAHEKRNHLPEVLLYDLVPAIPSSVPDIACDTRGEGYVGAASEQNFVERKGREEKTVEQATESCPVRELFHLLYVLFQNRVRPRNQVMVPQKSAQETRISIKISCQNSGFAYKLPFQQLRGALYEGLLAYRPGVELASDAVEYPASLPVTLYFRSEHRKACLKADG
eukprot:2845005-Rhodomonas_salina.2